MLSRIKCKNAATHAGLTVGEDGATHQSVEDISIMRSIPNMIVLNPADGIEANQCVIKAAEYKGPVYIRLGRSKVPTLFDEDYKFEIGKGVELKKGKDVTIIATGIMVSKALEASEILEKEGISVRVINISTIKPIDKEIIIKAARETKKIITAEEHSIIGGLGSAVAEVLVENQPVPMKRIGIEDTFGESGTAEDVLEKYGLTVDNIVKVTKSII